jgi:hypothetical protein
MMNLFLSFTHSMSPIGVQARKRAASPPETGMAVVFAFRRILLVIGKNSKGACILVIGKKGKGACIHALRKIYV